MSETWITLADSDVLPGNSPERIMVAKIKRADDLQNICGQVTEQIRQAYSLSNRDLGPDGTIPSGLKQRACAIALWRFVSEGVAKNAAIQTKERESAATAAGKYIDQIAAVQIGNASAPSVGKKPRKFRACQEDGI